MQPVITRYEVMEVVIPAATTAVKFNFPDMPNLRNAQILSMEFYPNGVITCGPNSGSDVIAIGDAARCFVTVYQGGIQKILNLPLVNLNRTVLADSATTSYVQDATLLNRMVVSWTKCYLSFFSVPSTLNVVVPIGITYLQPEDIGYQQLGQQA